MWQLSMKKAPEEWTSVGTFDSVTKAARRIREIEHYPDAKFALELNLDTVHGTDEEAFIDLYHTSRNRVLYRIHRW